MGSSFSDLDDASVTHSAMEEALAGQMRAAGSKLGVGMASLGVVGRMGGLWRQGVERGKATATGAAGRVGAAGGGSRTPESEQISKGKEVERPVERSKRSK